MYIYIYICLLPEGSGPCSSTPSKKHGSGTGLTEIITFAKPPETQRLLECFDFSISKFKKESLHLRNIHMLKRSLATIASKNLCCVAYPVLYKLCEQTWKDWFWTLKQRAKTSRRAGTAQHPYPPPYTSMYRVFVKHKVWIDDLALRCHKDSSLIFLLAFAFIPKIQCRQNFGKMSASFNRYP